MSFYYFFLLYSTIFYQAWCSSRFVPVLSKPDNLDRKFSCGWTRDCTASFDTSVINNWSMGFPSFTEPVVILSNHTITYIRQLKQNSAFLSRKIKTRKTFQFNHVYMSIFTIQINLIFHSIKSRTPIDEQTTE